MKSHVIRIPDNSDPIEYFILNVTSRNEDSSALELELEGTDGRDPFVGKVHQSRLSKLLQGSEVSLEQWESILRFTLLQQASEAKSAANVEMLATLAGDHMTIRFRKNISGIYQSIGQIKLKKDIDREIDVFKWISTALDHSSSLEQERQTAAKTLADRDSAVSKLSNQIEELQKAKDADTQELLDKFCEVLNSKKAKIRDQQRLLSTAKVDRAKAAQIQVARKSMGRRVPSSSGNHKRKSSNTLVESSDDDDFETMSSSKRDADRDADVDAGTDPDSHDEGAYEKTEDEATASEDGDSDDLDAPTQRSARSATTGKAKVDNSRNESADEVGVKGRGTLPSRQKLPSGRSGTAATVKNAPIPSTFASSSKQIEDEDDDVTTDDEL